jgi:hypothetical protein
MAHERRRRDGNGRGPDPRGGNDDAAVPRVKAESTVADVHALPAPGPAPPRHANLTRGHS